MNATIVVWAIRIICGLAFIILLAKSFSREHDGKKEGKDIDYTNIFTLLVLITIVYFSSIVDVNQEEELMSSAEIIHSVLSNLPGFLVAFGVYYFMRVKQKSVYREAYYKGQEDYSKMIPEREAHLEKQTKEFEEAFNKGLKYRGEPLKRAYYKGVIDGYQICEGTYPQQSYEFDKYINIISKSGFDEEQILNPLYSDWRNHIIDRYSLSETNQSVDSTEIADRPNSDIQPQSTRDSAIKNKKRMKYAYEQGLYDGFHYPYEVKGVEVPDTITNDVFDKKVSGIDNQIANIRNRIAHFEVIDKRAKDRQKSLEALEEKLKKGKSLTYFDPDLFEAAIERITIGGYDENGDLDPYRLEFVLRNGETHLHAGRDYVPQRRNAVARQYPEEFREKDYFEICHFKYYSQYFKFARAEDGMRKVLLDGVDVRIMWPVARDEDQNEITEGLIV